MKKILLLMSAGLSFCACNSSKQTDDASANTKSLIVYYSQTGATQQLAQALQQYTGADIEALSLVQPYDGDFSATIARCQDEMTNGTLPELNALTSDFAAYDTIYIAYPVWFGTYAMPVASLLQNQDFTGKVVVPFCTFGSGGLNTSSQQLIAQLPSATVLPGYGVRNARIAAASAELKQFLINSDIIAGEKVVLPDFTEQSALTEADQQLFDAACSSYSMPLGTPLTVGQRPIAAGTEYLFTVDANGSTAQIYVTAAEGAAPEFTQVVR